MHTSGGSNPAKHKSNRGFGGVGGGSDWRRHLYYPFTMSSKSDANRLANHNPPNHPRQHPSIINHSPYHHNPHAFAAENNQHPSKPHTWLGNLRFQHYCPDLHHPPPLKPTRTQIHGLRYGMEVWRRHGCRCGLPSSCPLVWSAKCRASVGN